jgi:hypothetical protein
VTIVRRMLNNLLSVYHMREEMERTALVRRYLAAL